MSIEEYERQRQALDRVMSRTRAEEMRRQSDLAARSAMSNALFGMAASQTMLSVVAKDQEVAARSFADGHAYMLAGIAALTMPIAEIPALVSTIRKEPAA